MTDDRGMCSGSVFRQDKERWKMDDRPPKAGKLRSDDGRLKAEGRGMCSEFSVQSSGRTKNDGRWKTASLLLPQI